MKGQEQGLGSNIQTQLGQHQMKLVKKKAKRGKKKRNKLNKTGKTINKTEYTIPERAPTQGQVGVNIQKQIKQQVGKKRATTKGKKGKKRE
jgi:hypothetical protein